MIIIISRIKVNRQETVFNSEYSIICKCELCFRLFSVSSPEVLRYQLIVTEKQLNVSKYKGNRSDVRLYTAIQSGLVLHCTLPFEQHFISHDENIPIKF